MYRLTISSSGMGGLDGSADANPAATLTANTPFRILLKRLLSQDLGTKTAQTSTQPFGYSSTLWP
jgi:hypothetical protein